MGEAWLGYYVFLNHILIFKPFHMWSDAPAANVETQFGTARLKNCRHKVDRTEETTRENSVKSFSF